MALKSPGSSIANAMGLAANDDKIEIFLRSDDKGTPSDKEQQGELTKQPKHSRKAARRAQPPQDVPTEPEGEEAIIPPSPLPPQDNVKVAGVGKLFLKLGLNNRKKQSAKDLLQAVDPAAPSKLISEEAIANIKVGQRTPAEALKGSDFNLDKIDTSEDVKTLIEQISELNPKIPETQKRGVQSFQTIQQDADELGLTPQDLLNIKPGEVRNAGFVKAARDVHAGIATKTATLVKEINAGVGGDDALIKLHRNLELMTQVQGVVKGLKTEAARVTVANKIAAADRPALRAADIEDLEDSLGGKEVLSAYAEALGDLIDKGGRDNLGKTVGNYAKQVQQPGTVDIIHEAWIGGLLTGLRTHARNLGSNAAVQMMLAMDRGIAGSGRSIYNLGRRTIGLNASEGITITEAGSFMFGQMRGFLAGWKAMSQALKTGKPSDTAQKFGLIATERDGAINGKNVYDSAIGAPFRAINKGAAKLGMDKVIRPINSIASKTTDVLGEYYFRLPFRFLQAEDELFKVMSFTAELDAQITRKVISGKLNGMEALEFKRAALENPREIVPDAYMEARRVSREATFTTRAPRGGVAQKVQQVLNAKEARGALKFIVPFFNVTNNIFKFAANRTPLKYMDLWRRQTGSPEVPNLEKLLAADPHSRDMEIAKITTGSMLMGTTTAMVWGALDNFGLEGVRFRGEIRGSNREKAASRMVQRQGNSIFVPWSQLDPGNVFKGTLHDGKDKSYRMEGFDPVSTLVSFSGMIAEMMKYAETDEEREFIGFAAAIAFKDTLLDKSYMTGISQFFDGFTNSGSEEVQAGKIQRWTSRFAGSWIPQWIQSWEREKDPTIRQSRPTNPYDTAWGRMLSSWGQQMCSRWPGCSKDLPPMVNALGDEISFRGAVGPDIMSPVYTNEPVFNTQDLIDAGIPANVIDAPRFMGLKAGPGGDMTFMELGKFIKVAGIESELERVGMPFGMPRREIGGISITPNLWVKMMKQEGPEIRKELTELMTERCRIGDVNCYISAPEGEGVEGSKQDMIKSVVSEVRKRVREDILAQDPDFIEVRQAQALRQYIQETGRFPVGSTRLPFIDGGGGFKAGQIVPPGREGQIVDPARGVEESLRRKFDQ